MKTIVRSSLRKKTHSSAIAYENLLSCDVDLSLVSVFVFFRVCVQACIGFTKKQDNQIKQTCYAQASQIRAVRKKMCDIITEEATKCDLKELVLKL